MSLIDYWPYPTFRDGQKTVLEQIEQAWDRHDVIIVRAPTAFGKEPLAVAIQNWNLANGSSSAITVPNNVLREQALLNWPHLKTVKAMDDYWIDKYNMSEKEFRQKIFKWGPKDSQYNIDRAAAKRIGTPVCVNYYSYIAHKLQRNVVIVDEAHLLLNTLQDFAARKIWKHKHNYPNNIKSLAQVKAWAATLKPSGPTKQLMEELSSLTPATLVQITDELYRGQYMPCIKLIPMSVENRPPIFWPTKTDKIVLISATLGPEDVKLMGLNARRIKWIDATSPIPADRRAIVCDFIGNMSYASQDANIPVLVNKIKELRETHEGNGFVHASYALALKLRHHMRDCDWAVFHDNKNKQDQYDAFSTTDPSHKKVMIGSGMFEGINMQEDIARWQAIAKIPYPSLADPAVRWIAKNKREYYQWMVSKDVMQSAGRVCRGPTDFGVTYVLDNCWTKWYDGCKDTLPTWFKEAVV